MNMEPVHSVLSGFDFSLLDDPLFKEDSVREEVIVPILKGLGYTISKPNKIIRSKPLLHPFVSIGSVTKKIYIIPDYLMEVNDRFAWVLEAKGPDESILNSKHVEQAYSYAIHTEIRVPYFALCNGREFVLYHISKTKPIVHFNTRLLGSYWENLKKLLAPQNSLTCDFTLAKDFGLHLQRLGFDEFESLIFPGVPISVIGHFEDGKYTFGAGIPVEGGDAYLASFDFDRKILCELKGKIPQKAFDVLMRPLGSEIIQMHFPDMVYKVTVECRVGQKLEENDDEIFRPLVISRVFG